MSAEIDDARRRFLAGVALTFIGRHLGTMGLMFEKKTLGRALLSSASELDSLQSATAWLNTPRLSAADLRGRVVAVQFWTFTCINWLRTLPYVRAWSRKYHDAGLVMIGVHAPEFTFEHDLENVRREVKALGVDYPVAVDNDFAIWRGFRNQYWPALYLIDGNGRVQHHRFGESDYSESERVLQQLLTDAGAARIDRPLGVVDGRGAEAAADWTDLRSGENYVDYERTQNFSSPEGAALDRHRTYSVPRSLSLNHWALGGDWTVKKQPLVSDAPNGRIAYCFHGRDLNLVMGPPSGAKPVRFRVRLDGRAPGAAHGVDVDEEGNGVATTQRMYQLIRQEPPIADRTFEIEFIDPGLEAFSFTFG